MSLSHSWSWLKPTARNTAERKSSGSFVLLSIILDIASSSCLWISWKNQQDNNDYSYLKEQQEAYLLLLWFWYIFIWPPFLPCYYSKSGWVPFIRICVHLFTALYVLPCALSSTDEFCIVINWNNGLATSWSLCSICCLAITSHVVGSKLTYIKSHSLMRQQKCRDNFLYACRNSGPKYVYWCTIQAPIMPSSQRASSLVRQFRYL